MVSFTWRHSASTFELYKWKTERRTDFILSTCETERQSVLRLLSTFTVALQGGVTLSTRTFNLLNSSACDCRTFLSSLLSFSLFSIFFPKFYFYFKFGHSTIVSKNCFYFERCWDKLKKQRFRLNYEDCAALEQNLILQLIARNF